MPEPIRVYKLDSDGSVKLHYDGVVLSRSATEVVLQAPWTRGTYDLGYVTFEPGDVFVEHFYADRWYNVFETYARDGTLKGWYCNVTRPPVLGPSDVRSEDLALDVWVWPDGRMQVLDEDEYARLDLSAEEQSAARAALQEIRQRVQAAQPPFTRPAARSGA